MLYYDIIRIKHNGKEPSDFKLNRPNGTDDYLFIHFKTPVIFTLFDTTHHISAGTCILLSPKTPHGFYPDECELVHDWMHFMPSNEDMFLNLGIDINAFFSIVNNNFITPTIKICELELIYKDELYKDLVSSEIGSMFIKLKRQLDVTAPSFHFDAFRELRVNLYQNPENYSNINDMAMAVNLSRSRFSIMYKRFFKVSPQADHINARIAKAKYLLSVGTLSLTEISELCGYQSIYHFIRQFRTITGTTPGMYRRDN